MKTAIQILTAVILLITMAQLLNYMMQRKDHKKKEEMEAWEREMHALRDLHKNQHAELVHKIDDLNRALCDTRKLSQERAHEYNQMVQQNMMAHFTVPRPKGPGGVDTQEVVCPKQSL